MRFLIKGDWAKTARALEEFRDDCAAELERRKEYRIAKKLGPLGEQAVTFLTGAIDMTWQIVTIPESGAGTEPSEKQAKAVLLEVPMVIPTEIRVLGHRIELKKVKKKLLMNLEGYLKAKGVECTVTLYNMEEQER